MCVCVCVCMCVRLCVQMSQVAKKKNFVSAALRGKSVSRDFAEHSQQYSTALCCILKHIMMPVGVVRVNQPQ